jgi:hypothetical protein
MTWEKPTKKHGKRKTGRIVASHRVGLVGLFSIIILILLIAPVLMWVAQGCIFTAQAREAQP